MSALVQVKYLYARDQTNVINKMKNWLNMGNTQHQYTILQKDQSVKWINIGFNEDTKQLFKDILSEIDITFPLKHMMR